MSTSPFQGEVACVARPAWNDRVTSTLEYLEEARHPVWKALLREGRADCAFAAQVGSTLARIHAATTGVAALFPTDTIFHAIRLEPYLLATGTRHPALRSRFAVLAAAGIDGLLFGIIHFDFSGADALLIVPPLALLGFIFCLVYERTGSLYPVIALHSLNHAIAYAVLTSRN